VENTRYEWPTDKRIGVVLSFDFDGESPYLWRNRADQSESLAQLEQRRFGPRQGVYRILELLSSLNITATAFIPGYIAEKYPNAVEKIAEQGHEIGLHGYCHERPDEISEDELESTLSKAREYIERITGPRAMGYRSPSWEMTAYTLETLKRQQVLYDSSLMGYDHPYAIDDMTEIPVQWILDDAIYYRYTGGLASPSPRNPGDVTDLWYKEFEGMKRWGGLFLITIHPWISGRAARLEALGAMLMRIKNDSDVWWGTCGEAAAHHKRTYQGQFNETSCLC
jgi:peptidoglycan/xylan/chitin deacetylase (PgdA/CDA1 family)